MKRNARKLNLHRETLRQLNVVLGGERPSQIGSDCAACITRVIPVTELDCATGGCATGAWSDCPSYCPVGCTSWTC